METGLLPVVSSLLLVIISVGFVKWLLKFCLKVGKSDNPYREFERLPRYGKSYTSSYEIVAPILFTKQTLPISVRSFQRVFAIFELANGAPLLRSNFFFTRHLAVLKASFAKVVLLDKENVQKTPQLYHFLEKWIRTGLITSDQVIWKDRRKKLAPTMYANVVDSYFQVFLDNSMTLVSKLESFGVQTVDIVPLMGLCALDIIVETSTAIKMGIQTNEDTEYLHSIHTLARASMQRIYTPWHWFDCIFKLCPAGKKYYKAFKYSRDFTMKVIEERKRLLIESKTLDPEMKHKRENDSVGSKLRGISFLDMVLKLHLEDESLTLEDVQDEIETLLFAGTDTTSVNMSFVLFLLGLDPTRLKKVHEELDSVLGTDPDAPVELNQLKSLPYLECVIKEAARLYPPIPAMGRMLQTDVRIGNLLIPKGTSFLISILHILKDPDVYPEPEKFIPERFLPDAEKPIDPIAFMPFSIGSRNCIGFKFSMLEMKVILSTILRRFSVESLIHRDKILMALGINQRPIDELPLRFHPR